LNSGLTAGSPAPAVAASTRAAPRWIAMLREPLDKSSLRPSNRLIRPSSAVDSRKSARRSA
jgi:hypothetical protein